MPRYTVVCLYEQAGEQAKEQASEQAKEQANAYANEHNKLNLTKLFNYLLNKKERNEFADENLKLNFSDKLSIIRVLKQIDFFIDNEEIVKLMTATELLKYQICYYAITIIYSNSYKTYLNRLTREILINKYLKSEEYCKNKSESEKIRYLVKSLQNELSKEGK